MTEDPVGDGAGVRAQILATLIGAAAALLYGGVVVFPAHRGYRRVAESGPTA